MYLDHRLEVQKALGVVGLKTGDFSIPRLRK
jgi:hypothetical protein